MTLIQGDVGYSSQVPTNNNPCKCGIFNLTLATSMQWEVSYSSHQIMCDHTSNSYEPRIHMENNILKNPYILHVLKSYYFQISYIVSEIGQGHTSIDQQVCLFRCNRYVLGLLPKRNEIVSNGSGQPLQKKLQGRSKVNLLS